MSLINARRRQVCLACGMGASNAKQSRSVREALKAAGGVAILVGEAALYLAIWVIGAGIGGGGFLAAFVLTALHLLVTWGPALLILRRWDMVSAVIFFGCLALAVQLTAGDAGGWPLLLLLLLWPLLPALVGITLLLRRGGRILPDLRGEGPAFRTWKFQAGLVILVVALSALVLETIPYPYTELHRSILEFERSKDLEAVKRALEAGGDINAPSRESGGTALHIAARTGNGELGRILLAAGAAVTARNEDGETPLHVAAAWNDSPEVLADLIAAGADLEARDQFGRTPLHVAAAWADVPEVVAVLLAAGANIGARTDFGDTPLHEAAGWHARRTGDADLAIVKLLVTAGGAVDARNNYGRTPLHEAASSSHDPRVIESLVQAGADVAAVTSSRWRERPIHVASRYGEPEIVQALIGAGADVNARDRFGNTPLHWVVELRMQSEHRRDDFTDDIAIIEALLGAGADPLLKDGDGRTPLELVPEGDHGVAVAERLRAFINGG